MFGIDGWELLIIGVIAVIVLGPERLPKAARFAGLWVRRARAQWYSVKSELERELAAEELKRSLHDTRRAVADIDAEIGQNIRNARDEARREFEAMRGDIEIGASDVSGDSTPVEHASVEHASVEHASVEYALVEPVGIDYASMESPSIESTSIESTIESTPPAPPPAAATTRTSPSSHGTPDDRG